MNEMIERVAKAMAEADASNTAWKLYVREARAAIKAMREPTDEMIEATRFAVQAHSSARDADRALYRAMIDAALGEASEALS